MIDFNECRFQDCFGDLPLDQQKRLRWTIIAMTKTINQL
jgi:hypothetical protein